MSARAQTATDAEVGVGPRSGCGCVQQAVQEALCASSTACVAARSSGRARFVQAFGADDASAAKECCGVGAIMYSHNSTLHAIPLTLSV
eukprot:scaffold20749_cov109-Isochrysis_galbana.AAC.2